MSEREQSLPGRRDAALDLTSIIWYMHEARTSAAGNTTASMSQSPFHSDEFT